MEATEIQNLEDRSKTITVLKDKSDLSIRDDNGNYCLS